MVSDATRSDSESLFRQARRLSREQMIEQIRAMNPGASHEYLERFQTPALSLYLEHLNVTQEPRGTVWNRPGDTPAILTRNPRE